MAFIEAREDFGKVLRFEEQGDDSKTLYLGKKVVGFYIEKKEDVGKNKATLYVLKLKDGQIVSLWGSVLLDGKFDKVPSLGCMVSVEFLGVKQPKRAGGNEYKDFQVMYDENTREMKEAVAAGSQEAHNEQATADAADEGY